MKRKYGKVIEIFIPEEYKNGTLLDVMDRTQIGFKIMTENEVIEVIQKQDEFNGEIMKNDVVIVTKQNISRKEFIDIELYEGDLK